MCNLVNINTNYNTQVQVAEIKRDNIQNIINAASKCAHIQEIILFGSALEERCTDESDIDIVIISNVSRSRLYRLKTYAEFLTSLHKDDDYMQQYDVICVNGKDQLIKNKDKIELYGNVIKYGQTIYKRGAA